MLAKGEVAYSGPVAELGDLSERLLPAAHDDAPHRTEAPAGLTPCVRLLTEPEPPRRAAPISVARTLRRVRYFVVVPLMMSAQGPLASTLGSPSACRLQMVSAVTFQVPFSLIAPPGAVTRPLATWPLSTRS